MSNDPAGLAPEIDPSEMLVAAIAGYSDIESILEVCARSTGMRYCVVAHVTEQRWLACAVLDDLGFNLPAGGELPIKTTLCNEVRLGRATIAFDQASADPRWRDHHTITTYGLESYIAAPIVLSDGTFFGTLCAIDTNPAPASRNDIVRMFELFAKLIAHHLDAERRVAASEAALFDAHETADLREQFLAVLGHDLRNPLAAMDAGMSLLRRRIDADSPIGRIFDEMDRSSGRMRRLINDILDFARGRLGGGVTITRRNSADVAAAVQQAVDDLAKTHPDRTVLVDIPHPLPMRCDPDRIAQLTANLLTNAASYGDPAVPIRVEARREHGMLVLAVVNGGPAIPAETRRHLFQPFHRGRPRGGQNGLGLGLYIASQIAIAHGGTLNVTSDDDETRFTFVMPAA